MAGEFKYETHTRPCYLPPVPKWVIWEWGTIYNRYYSRILVCLLLPELQCANPPKHTQHTQLTVVLTTHVGYVAPQLRAFMAGGFIVVRAAIWSEFRLNPTYASH